MQNRRFLPHLLGARTWQGTLAGMPALPPGTAADPAHRSRYFLSCQKIIGMGHQGHVVAASKRFDESCINPTPQANSPGFHRLRACTRPDQGTVVVAQSLPFFQAGLRVYIVHSTGVSPPAILPALR